MIDDNIDIDEATWLDSHKRFVTEENETGAAVFDAALYAYLKKNDLIAGYMVTPCSVVAGQAIAARTLRVDSPEGAIDYIKKQGKKIYLYWVMYYPNIRSLGYMDEDFKPVIYDVPQTTTHLGWTKLRYAILEEKNDF